MEQTIIDRLHGEFAALSAFLDAHSEPSLAVTADDCFRKLLLLSAGSLFETMITAAIHDFIAEASSGNARVLEFVRRKALARQYHTLFAWDDGRLGPFLTLFGEEFRGILSSRLKTDEPFAKAVAAFLEIGRERNRLVHQNLGHVALEKTAEEIFELYQTALQFVTELPALLRATLSEATAG
jgi:hypothetical protein